jgi:hypothetical protein
MPDEEDNCTSDEHVSNEASDRWVEHHYIPRSMLCRGIYEWNVSKSPFVRLLPHDVALGC